MTLDLGHFDGVPLVLSVLGLLALAGVWFERRLRGDRGFAGQRPSGALQRQRLTGVRAATATAVAAAVLGIAFVLPLGQLLAWAAKHATADLDARYWAFAGHSVALAASGAAVVVAAALVHGYALRMERRPWLLGLGRFATVGYAVPGTVLAVGLFAPVAALNGWLQGRLDLAFGETAPQLFLQGTLLTMFVAYLARFLAVGTGPVENGLERIHRNLDEAAMMLGARGPARAHYADRIEQIIFNAAPGAVTKDFKTLQYFSCPNQVIATENSNHNHFLRGFNWMMYRPDHEVQCCPGNLHRAMPNYVSRMWLRAPDGTPSGGIVAALYGPDSIQTTAGVGQIPLTITAETASPFEQAINFIVQPERQVRFAFWLRLPSWCSRPTVSINDQPVRQSLTPGGFLQLERDWQPGGTFLNFFISNSLFEN